eukprot:31439-Pelagococcus_subviridis.AAC.31
MGGEKCRQKSLRIGVHHANVVVWEPVYRTRLIQRAHVRRQAAVDAQHLSVDQRGEGEVIEHVRAPPPRVRVAVLPLALVVESVHLRDLPRLVVSSE